MSKFYTNLVYKKLDGLNKVRLTEELAYGSDYLKCIVLVPIGFSTDMTSFPRGLNWLRWAFVLDETVDRASVVHDYLCRYREKEPFLSFYDCDRTFREALGLSNAPWYQRWAFYLVVRFWHIFGYK